MPYIDPGAVAWDNVDGNLTSTMSVFGVAAVTTSSPTLPESPFKIYYDVQDGAGNSAVTAVRWLSVMCPQVQKVMMLSFA